MIVQKNVNKENCRKFLSQHPKLRELLLRKYPGKTTLKRYQKFIKVKGQFKFEICDYCLEQNSATFGNETFPKWNWHGVKGFAELFQYVEDNLK